MLVENYILHLLFHYSLIISDLKEGQFIIMSLINFGQN